MLAADDRVLVLVFVLERVEVVAAGVRIGEVSCRLRDVDANAPWRSVDAVVVEVALEVRVVEHAAAAADAGAAIARDVPGEAKPDANVVPVGIRAILRHARVAAVKQSRRRVGKLRRPYTLRRSCQREVLEAADDVVPGCRGLVARAQGSSVTRSLTFKSSWKK